MQTVVPARPPVLLPVTGTEARFPVGRLFCVGQNYAAHAREMGANPDRQPPFFFCKDADAVAGDGSTIPYPPGTSDFHHEVELIVAIGHGAESGEGAVDPAALIFGYAVGLDMTRRDVQTDAKKAGRPWSVAKNFPLSAPVGAIAPVASAGDLAEADIALTVNGDVRQQSHLRDMIWSVPEIIAALLKVYPLRPGDLIFTGTPAGVGPVARGDTLKARVGNLPELTVRIG